ncbi:MAG TPA: DUF6458 family protein [Actinomycetota bacterium]
MNIGASIFLLVVGAILTFAVNATTHPINVNVIGVILMVTGAGGMLMSLLYWNSWSPWSRRRRVINPGPVLDGDRIIEERHYERNYPDYP